MTRYSEKVRRQNLLHRDERRKVRTEHRLLEDVPETNKWIAEDYMREIKHDFDNVFKDIIRHYNDLEPLSESIISLYKNIWNNGLDGVTEDMPVEKRRSIYQQKLKTWFWYKCFNWIRDSKNRREFDNMHDHIDDECKKSYEGEKVRQVQLADEKDTQPYIDAAMHEATLEYVSRHRMKIVSKDKSRLTYSERQLYANYVYSVFRMYYRDGMTYKQIAEKWKKTTQVVSNRNRKTVAMLKEHTDEIMAIARRIYDEKYEFL